MIRRKCLNIGQPKYYTVSSRRPFTCRAEACPDHGYGRQRRSWTDQRRHRASRRREGSLSCGLRSAGSIAHSPGRSWPRSGPKTGSTSWGNMSRPDNLPWVTALPCAIAPISLPSSRCAIGERPASERNPDARLASTVCDRLELRCRQRSERAANQKPKGSCARLLIRLSASDASR